MKVYAVIVAAGQGVRLGGNLPKQYQTLHNQTLLETSLAPFLISPQVQGVIPVISEQHIDLYNGLALRHEKLLPYVLGGVTRQASVKLGLDALEAYAPTHVLIHDSARPFVSMRIIDDVIATLQQYDAVDVLLEVADTIKDMKNAHSQVKREDIRLIQTPQGFKYSKIRSLHTKLSDVQVSDDIALATAGGMEIGFVQGERINFKITTYEDLAMARQIQAAKLMPTIRIGHGIDVHELRPTQGTDTTIPICGVHIPHTKEVIAHSDGDVGLHALVDAILGALALNDIGTHFPPSDERWRDADSKDFLRHVKTLLDELKAKIHNIDITILCEAPKINPYKIQMRECIAEILEINVNQVNIKATTTEKLGFIGREEGVAAQAVCILQW